ncbi:hypothetical protein SmJEL517_g05369 [Synchytrium microbalum]|uniref:CCZ1/INTU/HPS4 third Longin domain-containing protein n=1 Tax=Synchytrium microbalum TaxID=1806994 RepID=A0A507BLL6_9FUNG|nr:uncharacterized protein SmJEL517_g05369 [Synchytrium microbalum]TPX31230.1 hypothetical protein SmJEL517_g05369 [Synchytrium microbalum]
MIQPEPSYWLMMKVKLATAMRTGRDGKKTLEHLDADLPDAVVKHILWRAYHAFRLFHKSFAHVNHAQSPVALRQRLDEFFSGYLMKLTPTLSHPDLVSALEGVHFLPLDRTSYLQTVSFVQDLEARFGNVTATVVLWRHHLVSSGLKDLLDLKSFYDYITDPETGKIADGIVSMVKPKGESVIASRPTTLRPTAAALALQNAHSSSDISSMLFSALTSRSSRFTGFIVPSFNPSEISVPVHPKKLFIGRDAEEMFVVLYQNQDELTIALFISTAESHSQTVPPSVQARDRTFYTALSAFLESRCPHLSSVISDGFSRTRKISEYTDQHYRYLYYNAANLAFKTSIGTSKSAMVTPEIAQCLNEIHEDFESTALNLTETSVRSVAEFWILARKSEGREFYLVLPKAEMTLLDVDEEMQKLTHSYFSNIFLD